MGRISRAVIHYYTALRLSAGAALLYLPFETPGPRVPIVRAAETETQAGFDRREVVELADGIGVVTLPLRNDRAPHQPLIGLN